MSKHIKGSKERYLLGQDKTSKFGGKSLLSSYKMTIKSEMVKNYEKLSEKLKHLSVFG